MKNVYVVMRKRKTNGACKAEPMIVCARTTWQQAHGKVNRLRTEGKFNEYWFERVPVVDN